MSPRCAWHRGSNQTRVPALRIACLSQTLYDPGYCSGPISPSSPATQELPAYWTSSVGDSGGHPWMRTSVRSSQRAQPVPGIRPRLGPVPVYFDHYPFLADLGLTLPRHRSAPVRGQHHHPHSDRPLFQGRPLHRASQASLLKGDCGPPGQARILLRLRLLSTPVPFVSDLPHPSVYI